jgi:hypothetical protein
MEIEIDSGGKVQPEGVALDEKMRDRLCASVVTEQVTEMKQGNAQGRPAMHCISFWPELFREHLA